MTEKYFWGVSDRNAREFAYGFVDDEGDEDGSSADGATATAIVHSDAERALPLAGRELVRHGGHWRPVTRWEEAGHKTMQIAQYDMKRRIR